MPHPRPQLRNASDASRRVVSIGEAALALDVSVSTLRRWTAEEGCPCESPGAAGRGNGATYHVETVRRWRAARHGVELRPELDFDRLAEGLLEALRRGNAGESRPVHEVLGISARKAAVIYAEAYVALVRTLTGREPDEYPPAVQTLHGCAVSLLSRHLPSERPVRE